MSSSSCEGRHVTSDWVLITSFDLNTKKFGLLGQGPHQIVLDKPRCSLGIVHPAAQRDHKLVGLDTGNPQTKQNNCLSGLSAFCRRLLDGARAVEVDHVEELLQIHFVNVHDSKPSRKELSLHTSHNKVFLRPCKTWHLTSDIPESFF